jgi:hypothetical protein
MKNSHTRQILSTVLINPAHKPASRALQNTAGKNQNQTNGFIHCQHSHCTPSAKNGRNIASAKRSVIVSPDRHSHHIFTIILKKQMLCQKSLLFFDFAEYERLRGYSSGADIV